MKGNVLIAQSGGPTAVINSSCCGIVQEAMKHENKIGAVYGAVNGILGVLNEEMIDLRKESKTTIELLRQTPSSALGSCRYSLIPNEYERVFDVIKTHNIRYCLFIGGNDTMDTAYKVSKLVAQINYEMQTIGVPKTVDNDLLGTDHCPGYPSAARWLAIAVRDAGLDTKAIYSTDSVKIIETMGRNSGWLTASTALARDEYGDPPHLVYLPERVFYKDKFLADVQRVYHQLGYVVIAVCEGLKDEKGQAIVESKVKIDVDSFGHAQSGGIADFLCHLIRDELKLKARFDKPGTIQRVSMVCASDVDIAEAYMVGKAAVQMSLQGKSGCMVTLQRQPVKRYESVTGSIALDRVANKEKQVPDIFINNEANDVTEQFIKWAKPLIKPGLPKYARLKKTMVKKRLKAFYA